MIDFKSLAKAGVHFGHQTSRWSPKMAPYIWGHRSGIHLIDISKTAYQIEKAAKFLESVATEGKQILWVGTKKAAQGSIKRVGESSKMPFVVHRWIGGTLTNFSQVKKSITRLLHFEDILDKSSQFSYTKKELNTFQKIVNRLEQSVGGIRTLKWPVGAVVLVDVRKEQTALREAVAIGVPVVSIVDTNADPTMVDYVIPGNDDSPKAIKIVVEYLGEAVQRGLKTRTEKPKKLATDATEASEKTTVTPQVTKVEEKKKTAVEVKPKLRKVAADSKQKPKVSVKKKEEKAASVKKEAAPKKAASASKTKRKVSSEEPAEKKASDTTKDESK